MSSATVSQSPEPGRSVLDQSFQAAPPFAEGEKVLAYHGPMMYGAKVQTTRKTKGKWEFNLHYLARVLLTTLNWEWDEWAPAERLLKDTPENQVKSQKLASKLNDDKKKEQNGTPGKEKGKAEKGGRRRKSESSAGAGTEAGGALPKALSPPETPSGVAVQIKLPHLLRNQLIQDWKLITEQGKLVQLPRQPSVIEILERYKAAKAEVDSEGADSTAEVASGLMAYFERALPAILLYKQERSQYLQALPEGTTQTPSEVYGAEHLLRLFIKLPELLSFVPMESETMTLLLQKLHEFLKYLVKMQPSFFAGKYFTPPEVEAEGVLEKERGSKRMRKTSV